MPCGRRWFLFVRPHHHRPKKMKTHRELGTGHVRTTVCIFALTKPYDIIRLKIEQIKKTTVELLLKFQRTFLHTLEVHTVDSTTCEIAGSGGGGGGFDAHSHELSTVAKVASLKLVQPVGSTGKRRTSAVWPNRPQFSDWRNAFLSLTYPTNPTQTTPHLTFVCGLPSAV